MVFRSNESSLILQRTGHTVFNVRGKKRGDNYSQEKVGGNTDTLGLQRVRVALPQRGNLPTLTHTEKETKKPRVQHKSCYPHNTHRCSTIVFFYAHFN